jgi:hypothetical protein
VSGPREPRQRAATEVTPPPQGDRSGHRRALILLAVVALVGVAVAVLVATGSFSSGPEATHPASGQIGGAAAKAGAKPCGGGVLAGPATTCPFAHNVFVGYWEAYESRGALPHTKLTILSPSTEDDYGVSCSLNGATVECSGEQNAFVKFPIQAVRSY